MKRAFLEYSLIVLGTLLLSVGMNLFLVPIKLSSGGVGSIGTVLYHTLSIPLFVTNLVLNAVLFIVGFKLLGGKSFVKTVVGTLLLTLFLAITQSIPAPTDDILCALVVGGGLVGLGVGLVIRAGGSTGGSDLLGIILKHPFAHISIATIILVIDVLVIIVAGVVFRDFEITVYSIICMFISSRVSDMVLSFGSHAKSVYINSQKNDEIKGTILKDFERGVTEIYTQGGFTQEKRKMIFCVLSPKEVPNLVKTVKAIDKNAFIVISDAKEVLGEGFAPALKS